MTITDRKEKAILHKQLIDLLTTCKDDNQFLKRLIWANEIINNAIADFSNEEYMETIVELEQRQNNLTTPARKL